MPPFLWFGLPQATFRCGLPGGLYGNSELGRTRGLQAVTSHPEERLHLPTQTFSGEKEVSILLQPEEIGVYWVRLQDADCPALLMA